MSTLELDNKNIDFILTYGEGSLFINGRQLRLTGLYYGNPQRQIALYAGSDIFHDGEPEIKLDHFYCIENDLDAIVGEKVSLSCGEGKRRVNACLTGIGNMADGDFDGLVSWDVYKSLKRTGKKIQIWYYGGERATDSIRQWAEQTNGQIKIIEELQYVNRQFRHRCYIIMGVLCISMLNIMELYGHMIRRRERELHIYYINGMNRKQELAMMWQELFVFITVGWLMGVLFLSFIRLFASFPILVEKIGVHALYIYLAELIVSTFVLFLKRGGWKRAGYERYFFSCIWDLEARAWNALFDDVDYGFGKWCVPGFIELFKNMGYSEKNPRKIQI